MESKHKTTENKIIEGDNKRGVKEQRNYKTTKKQFTKLQ